MTRFSVLIPTHNRPDVLEYAVRSVLYQTEHDFEILVAGDGCTDSTGEVVQSFKDDRIRWFDLPKAIGVGYANRNIALKEARGKYVAWLGHDDLLLPDHLALLAECLEARQAALVYSRPLWVSPDGTVFPSAVNLESRAALDTFLNRHNSIPATCFVYPRENHDKFGYLDETRERGSDYHFWKRIVQGSSDNGLAFLPIPTTLHFNANWRKADYVERRPYLAGWLTDVGRRALPESLKLTVPVGELEQAVFWRAMSADKVGWAKNIRYAVNQALDNAAQEFLDTKLQLDTLQAENARMRAAIDRWRNPFGLRRKLGTLWRRLRTQGA